MNKKLQVFISSTFIDLQDERQAAVEAILKAGHIPAGMELFKAGNQSQWDTITRWIDESDIYMLILGGRYGTIEDTSKKSYTHLEYEYAVSKGIPVFAVTLTDGAIQLKVESLGFEKAIERQNTEKYNKFKKMVRSKMCTDVADTKDIKLAVLDSLQELQRLNTFSGWISGKEFPDVSGLNQLIIELQQENMKLMKDNLSLNESIERLEKQHKEDAAFNGLTFQELISILQSETVTLPSPVFSEEQVFSLLECFTTYSSKLATGVTNGTKAHQQSRYFFFNIAPLFMRYGLMEKIRLTGTTIDKIQISQTGHKFLAILDKEKLTIASSNEVATTEE